MPFLIPAGAAAGAAAATTAATTAAAATAVGSTAILAPVATTAAASAFSAADALTIAGLAGSVFSAGSTLLAGQQQKDAAKAQATAAENEADQLKVGAGQERAQAQQAAIQERRTARLAASRNQAVAAASGGGADDPTVLAIDEGLAGQGEYNALTALYQGEARARGMEGDANAARFQAASTRSAGRKIKAGAYVGATQSLLNGAGNTLLYKYG